MIVSLTEIWRITLWTAKNTGEPLSQPVGVAITRNPIFAICDLLFAISFELEARMIE